MFQGDSCYLNFLLEIRMYILIHNMVSYTTSLPFKVSSISMSMQHMCKSSLSLSLSLPLSLIKGNILLYGFFSSTSLSFLPREYVCHSKVIYHTCHILIYLSVIFVKIFYVYGIYAKA